MRLALTSLILAPSIAFANCTEDAMLVFDASSSMTRQIAGSDHGPRIVEAREALREALPAVAPYRRIGLIVYGPGETQGCSHVDLHLPPTRDAASEIIAEVDALDPDGSTALTQAVQDAASYLQTNSGQGTIVLVTDGEETCGGRTCAVAQHIAAAAPDMTVHVIGFQMRQTYLSLDYSDFSVRQGAGPVGAQCLAAHTGGIYVTATTVPELVDALHATLGCPLQS